MRHEESNAKTDQVISQEFVRQLIVRYFGYLLHGEFVPEQRRDYPVEQEL